MTEETIELEIRQKGEPEFKDGYIEVMKILMDGKGGATVRVFGGLNTKEQIDILKMIIVGLEESQ